MSIKIYNKLQYLKISILVVAIFFAMVDYLLATDIYYKLQPAKMLAAKLTLEDLKKNLLFGGKNGFYSYDQGEDLLIERISFPLHLRPFELLCDICKMVSDNEGVSIFMEILDEDGELIVDIIDPLEEVAKQFERNNLKWYHDSIKGVMEENSESHHGAFRIKRKLYARLTFKHKLFDSEYRLNEKARKIIAGFFGDNIKRDNGSHLDVAFSLEESNFLYHLDPEDYKMIKKSLGYTSNINVNYTAGYRTFWKRPEKRSYQNSAINPMNIFLMPPALESAI